MPKRKEPPLTPQEQSERFKKAVRDLEAAGELSPAADADFERAVGGIKQVKES